MPQDGSSNYYYPPGTPGVPDQTIESEAYNTFLDDLVTNDLNIPRPIHRGGTGAATAYLALVNLTGEKATQLVSNYDSHVWLPGSFRSTNTPGQGAPVDGHAFAGIAYINEALTDPPANANVIIEARDQSDTEVPGRVYVRQKKAGVWEAWFVQAGNVAALDAAYVNVDGDTMTGLLTLSADPETDLQAATKQYADDTALAVATAVATATFFPAGTRLLFQQTTPPTGWSRVATHHDKALRIVGTGSVGSGGTVAFSTVFAKTATDGFTLTNTHLPDISVELTRYLKNLDDPLLNAQAVTTGCWAGAIDYQATDAIYPSSSGGGSAHAHPMDIRVTYVDVILAQKD